MKTIKIAGDEYKVREAKTSEEKAKGLMGVKKLADDEGMLFYFDNPQKVSFWMKDTEIPLDIIFINEDEEVISVAKGKPHDETPLIENDVKWVLELNANSGVRKGDDVDINPENDLDKEFNMKMLAPDGSVQFRLKGGERIFSRKNTRVMIKQAKKAYKSKSDSDYKRLGKSVFKYLDIQDGREPEYVSLDK